VCKHLIPRDLGGATTARAALLIGSVMLCGIGAPLPLSAQLAEGPAAAQTPRPVDQDRIQPGDVVRLTFLSGAGPSGEFPVNQFGTVVLPVVGEYDISAETNRSFRDRVLADLRKVRYAPDVELVVLRRVRVLGEVNRPGVYPLDPTLSIADAIATAGGRTTIAEEGRVMLRRGGEVVDTDLRLDVRISDLATRSGDEIFVPRQGWLDRNLTAVVAGISTVVGVVITLIVR
jgi:protein involved in polysaccharide export with SLBB domain